MKGKNKSYSVFQKKENPYYLFHITFRHTKTDRLYSIIRVAYSLDRDLGIIREQEGMEVVSHRYSKLAKQKEFQKLRGQIRSKLSNHRIDNRVLLKGDLSLYQDNVKQDTRLNVIMDDLFSTYTRKDKEVFHDYTSPVVPATVDTEVTEDVTDTTTSNTKLD